jgi:hypothetical protein
VVAPVLLVQMEQVPAAAVKVAALAVVVVDTVVQANLP